MSVASALDLTPAVLGGGGGSQNLSQVLTTGNSAGSSDIDMNNNDITGANAITCDTLNYTTLNPPVGGATILLNQAGGIVQQLPTTGSFPSGTIYTIPNVPVGLIQFSVLVNLINPDTNNIAVVFTQNIYNLANTSLTEIYSIGLDDGTETISANANQTQQITITFYNTAVQTFNFSFETFATSSSTIDPVTIETSNALMVQLA
jgi:archaellin